MTKSSSAVKKCSKTRAKLEEARFFLNKLKDKENWNGSVINYYLSAFISSSRSVLWIMRSEYKNVSGWEDWYDLLKPTVAQKAFIKNVTDIRNRSEKEEPLQVGGRVVFTVPKDNLTEDLKAFLKANVNKPFLITVADANKVSDQKTIVDLTNNRARSIAKLDKVFFTVRELPDRNIITVCNRYFNLLNGMVRKCESLFAIPGQGAVLYKKIHKARMRRGT